MSQPVIAQEALADERASAPWSAPPPERTLPLGAILQARKLRLRTLVFLRWLAVIGQTAAVLFVHFGLGFPLPLGLCLLAISASAWLNVAVSLRFASSKRLSEREAAFYLAFDLVQLTVLLMLTGGLKNPFALLFLAPATISATTLSLRATLTLGGFTLACILFIGIVHWPLPWYPDRPLEVPTLYTIGSAAALVLGLGFTAGYAWRVAAEANRMSHALAATQFVLAREQKLSAVGGLAAAAAHELGTPLSTIALTAKELAHQAGAASPLADDLALIREQAGRCREILSRLAHHGDAEDAHYARLQLGALLEEVAEPHLGFGVAIELKLEGAGGGREPAVWRRPEILYGLGNILENAVDFATETVLVKARWSAERIAIEIIDDGPGFSADIIDSLGEPYVSTRARPVGGVAGAGDVVPPYHDPDGHEGMGLGFFIAKTLIERTGGVVSFSNRSLTRPGTRGAVVTVEWPRGALEAGPAG